MGGAPGEDRRDVRGGDQAAAAAGAVDPQPHPHLARRLDAGESWESFRARWDAFARPDDLLCIWGRYPLDVLESEGVALPETLARRAPAAGTYFGTRVGAVEDCTERLGVPIPDPFAPGRGGCGWLPCRRSSIACWS